MGKIPSYAEQSLESISPGDILLGEKIVGTNKTATYTFQTLEQYFQGGGSGSSSLEKDVEATIDVGGVKEDDILPQFMTFTEFVEVLVAPLVNPTFEINFVVCGGISSGTQEVGSTIGATLTSTYDPGVIHSADGSPDVDLTGGKTTHLFSGSGVNGQTGVVLTAAVLGSNIWGVAQGYSQGNDPYYDSSGNPSTIFDAFRVAGTAFDNSNTITGKYKYWWSVGSIPTDSAGVRALTDDGFYPVSSFDIAIPQGETLVAFYLPSPTPQITVLYVESSFADVTGSFTITGMTVNDAAGNPVSYNRFESTIGGIGYAADATYRVNI